ncbi:MAG: DUF393 domain-containing protein [Pseudomonadota bacterium]
MNQSSPIYVVYDGECPFCSNYVKVIRLREALGRFELVDARKPSHVVDRLAREGIDLNEGMALVYEDRIIHGAECVHQLALMSTKSGLFNRLNSWIFHNRSTSRLLYPVLRFGRNTTLRLLGRKPIATGAEGR